MLNNVKYKQQLEPHVFNVLLLCTICLLHILFLSRLKVDHHLFCKIFIRINTRIHFI